MILLATYYAGEYWDYAEDSLSGQLGTGPFSGGSQVLQRKLLPRSAPLSASLLALAIALAVGLVLQFAFRTGRWTLPLGLLGAVGGFFYSSPPIRWVRTGLGELWIAFCYGWLPVATGAYLQVGYLPPLATPVSLPIAATIANVILLNEFPDYHPDLQTGKRNLTVRLGRERASWLYATLTAVTWFGIWWSVRRGFPSSVLWLQLPFLGLSAWNTADVLRQRWRHERLLQRLCASTIAVNLGTTAAYLISWWLA
jgi:1,4-dihydroxy-2-naphthoate octaprenyltransferase